MANIFLDKIKLKSEDVRDRDINELSKYCPNISELNLTGCVELTDAALEFLPKNLQLLNLDYCHQLTDSAIDKLPKSLKSLIVPVK